METSADPEPRENVGRYRLLAGVTRVLGMRLVASRVAPIMLGKTIRADPARRAEVAGYVQLMTRRRDIWRATNGVIDRAGIADELPRITAPALVVVGEEDVATVPAKAQRIAAAIAGARLVTIPGAGHSSSVEQPAAVTAALVEFLAGLPR
jgi:pimeloyl-ACP methyl ester carboxylesterase